MLGDRHGSQHLVNINLFKPPNYSMKEGLYISFLLLCKKKYHKLSSFLLWCSYCGLGVQAWLSCVFCFRYLGVHWKDWCWSWNSSTLATSYEELTHWKRLWCWEGLGAGGEGENRGWDGWMASLTQWAWVWVNSGSWWWTGRPGVLRLNWAIELNWTESCSCALTGLPCDLESQLGKNLLLSLHTLWAEFISCYFKSKGPDFWPSLGKHPWVFRSCLNFPAMHSSP